jgi:membrane dipeptidase
VRRYFLCAAALLAAPLHAADDAALAKARAILASSPLVDTHNDLPWLIREYKEAPGDVVRYDLRKTAPHETDLARLKSGQLAGQFWSVWIPSELKEGFARTQLEQIDLVRRLIDAYPEALTFATRASDVEAARKQGKVASFLGMENGLALENSIATLRAYYDLGARYMTLTHTKNTDWADSATDKPVHNGLTPFGKEVVREMNRLGMLVDISHVSPKAMHDALDVAEAPVIFSHSSAKAVVDHPRNVPDDVLLRLAKNGGVVMVTFIPSFVSKENMVWSKGLEQVWFSNSDLDAVRKIEAEYRKTHGAEPPATLQQVADHIDHVAKVAGFDHVGIGSDFWGGTMPTGLEDVSKYPYLLAELIRRGWSDDNVKKLAGGNLIRAFTRAEVVSDGLRKSRGPSLATIEVLDGASKPVAVKP